jgi:hypothetical protein
MALRTLLAASMLCCLGAANCGDTEYVHVGPNWAALNELEPSEKTFDVKISGADQLEIGDRLEVKVTSKKKGRLWLVRVDPDDDVTLLFPNRMDQDNEIPAGVPVRIPDTDDSWSLEASDPLGKSVLAAIVTTGDADLDDVLENQKSVYKALRLVEELPAWGIAKKVIDVSEAD